MAEEQATTQGELLPEAIEWQQLSIKAGQVFKPGAPVDQVSMLLGRGREIERVLDVVGQTGRHAIIYGERGVGKTSLATLLEDLLRPLRKRQVLAPRVQCGGTDTFASAWRMLFEAIGKVENEMRIGFAGEAVERRSTAAELIKGKKVTPDVVRRVLDTLADEFIPIAIFDEFDRLPAGPRGEFADMIKNLSDHAVRTTVVLVGVGDTVDQLIQEHQSVARALVEIHMERLKPAEIRSIVEVGLQQLQMKASVYSLGRIALLARGLPHYAHLLGLHSARSAIAEKSLEVTPAHVERAIHQALSDAQQHIAHAYHKATTSPRKQNLFGDVLLACALATVDDMGTFAAQDVREPLCLITQNDYDIPTFAQHLSEFSSEKRGDVLRRIGSAHRYRYRFVDSLLQPYVIMRGVSSNRVPAQYLEAD
jgi:Cdc6-like AAA superfamily ATPase